MKPDKTGGEVCSTGADVPQFLPFYEAWADWIGKRLGVSVIGKIFASVIPGLVFTVIHFLCTRGDLAQVSIVQFHAWSWMIGVMITSGMLALYFATHAFKGLFPQIDVWQNSDTTLLFLPRLNRTLSDRNFVLAGIFFGVLNMLMGYWFGVKYIAIASQASIYLGFFLVGFVCGMAAWGIWGILVTINVIIRKGLLHPDFTAPDHCGGTKFLGEAFVKFSAVTLIMGVMISVYIMFADWKNQDVQLVQVAMGLWIGWPYLLAAVVLAVPAVDVSQKLKDYQLKQERILHEGQKQLRLQLDISTITTERRQFIEAALDRFSKQRDLLYAMRIWPFGIADGAKYGVVLLGNMVASFQGVLKIQDLLDKT